MRPPKRFDLEILEGKALLSGVTSGLSDTLTVTPQTTTTGTSVVMTFTETNVSNHEITVDYGPVNDGFAVQQNGKTVWISNSGVLPQYLIVDMLKPGQSITLQATWNGQSNSGTALTGSFTVTNELGGAAAKATVTLLPPTTSPSTAVPPKVSPLVIPPKPPAHFVL